MSWTIFAQNILEVAASVGVNPAAAAGKDISRVFDRDKTFQYIGGSAAQTDIDAHFPSALPVAAVAFLNHNITGVTISFRAENATPATVERGTLAATGADFILLVSATFTDWRFRIPAMAFAPQIGEILLGVPRVVTQNPVLASAGRGRRPNVRLDESSGGFPVGVKLGVKRTVLRPTWNWIQPADAAAYDGAADDSADGTKPLLLQDEMGVLRWMRWKVPDPLNPVPIDQDANGATLYSIADGGEFVEVPA